MSRGSSPRRSATAKPIPDPTRPLVATSRLHPPLIPAERTGMSTVPKVFISATSGDLRSVRQIVKEVLLTINCYPVEQTNFEPDWRTVEGMLRGKIEGCQALLHIVGLRYGAEPRPDSLPPGTPRGIAQGMTFDPPVLRVHEELHARFGGK